MKLLLLKLSLITQLTMLVGCGDPFQGNSAGITETQLAGQNSTFAQVRAQVLGPSCINCHNDYANEAVVLAALPRIITRIESGNMPQGGPKLSDSLIALVKSLGQIPTPEVQPLEAKWESLRAQVFVPKCLVCHNPNGQASFFDMTTREAIYLERNRIGFNGQKMIDLDDPDNSYILTRVRDTEEPMPPLPPFSDIEQLTAEEVAVFKEWIEKGMP